MRCLKAKDDKTTTPLNCLKQLKNLKLIKNLIDSDEIIKQKASNICRIKELECLRQQQF
jgi:hypothetical protein